MMPDSLFSFDLNRGDGFDVFIPAFLTIYVAVMYSLQTKAFLSVATPYAIPHPVKRNRGNRENSRTVKLWSIK